MQGGDSDKPFWAKSKWFWAAVALILAGILWVAFAWLAAGNSNTNKAGLHQTELSLIPEAEPLYYYIDSAFVVNDLFSSVVLEGWTFNPTSIAAEDDMLLKVLFISSRAQYEAIPLKIARKDVDRIMRSDPNVPERLGTGFYLEVFPYTFSDGEYRISLALEESGELVANSEIEYRLVKDGFKTNLVRIVSEVYHPPWPPAMEDQQVSWMLDYAMQEGGIVQLSGWATLPDKTFLQQRVMVEVTYHSGETALYTALLQRRDEVMTIAQNPLCKNAGFLVEIPSQLANVWTIRFWVEADGCWHLSERVMGEHLMKYLWDGGGADE